MQYIYPRFYEGLSNYRRRLQPSKETFSTLHHEISSLFFVLCVIFTFLDPDPQLQLDPDPNRIRIRKSEKFIKGYTQLNGSSFSRTVASKRLTKKH